MTENTTINYIKLDRFKLRNNRDKIMLGVAVHFAVLRKEINLSQFNYGLKRFMDQQWGHYLNSQCRNEREIADSYGVNINLWQFHQHANICPQGRCPNLVRKIHSNYNYYGAIHFVLKKDSADIDLLILNPGSYGLNGSMTVNFKQALASNCKITINEVNEKWPQNQLKFREEKQLFQRFGVGLDLWTLEPKKCSKEITDVVPKLIFKSRYQEQIKLMVDHWVEDNTCIDIKDQFTISKFTLYQCPNDFCLYATTKRQTFERHTETCSDETVVEFEQRNLLEGDIVKWLIEENYLTEKPVIEPKHVHFDLETMLKPSLSQSNKTTCYGEERIISIGTSDTIHNDVRSLVFAREELDESSLAKMVDEFWRHLLVLRDEYRKSLPSEVNKAFFIIQRMLFPTDVDCFGNKIELPLADPLKCQLRRAFKYLDGIRSLKVVGWNSENFATGFLNFCFHLN